MPWRHQVATLGQFQRMVEGQDQHIGQQPDLLGQRGEEGEGGLRVICAFAWPVARIAPPVATMGPVVRIEFERVEALELLGMTLAHLKDAEARAEMSPRVALLMAIRDKLALGLREER